jgi:lipopolysaccharide heptosyltransferase II
MQILLVRLRLIGDVVFTTPAIRALRRHFPDARLTYLVEEAAAPVVRGNPHLDDVIAIRRTRGLARVREDFRIGRMLRARRFDMVIDFHGGPRGSWLTWLTGAPRRVGYAVAGRSWMYTTAVARPRELRRRHSVENQWDLLAALGLPAPDRARDPLEMVEDAEARAGIDRRLAAAGLSEGEPIVVMHVSAGNPFRRWPVESFAAVAAGLVHRDPARAVVLTSGPSERHAALVAGELARRQLGTAGTRILQIGEVSLTELRAMVGRAALYIGGDSGPLHVAGTTATPVVGLFGPTLAVRSMPWRDPRLPADAVEPGALACRPCDQRHCVTGDFRCLTGISPAQVIDAAERLLAGDTVG